MTTKTHIGSDFDEFLREAGIYDQAKVAAVERVLAYDLECNMQRAHVTKPDMAKRMRTTRAQLDRLLNPKARRRRSGHGSRPPRRLASG